VGWSFSLSHDLGYPQGAFFGLSHYHDSFFGLLASNLFYIPVGPRSVSSIFGFLGYQGSTDSLEIGLPPRPLGTFSANDAANYGSIISNFQLFASTLSGRRFEPPSSERERPCRHGTFSGSISATLSPINVYHDVLSIGWGRTVLCENTHGLIGYGFQPSGFNPLTGSLLVDVEGGTSSWNLLDVLDSLIGAELSDFVFDGSHLVNRVISSVDRLLTQEYCLIFYHCHVHDITGGGQWDWDTTIVIPFEVPPVDLEPGVGSNYRLTRPGFTTYRFANGTSNGPFAGPSEGVCSEGHMTCGPLILGYPDRSPIGEWGRAMLVRETLRSGRFLNKFVDAVDKDFRDLATSSLFSTVDAFKEAEGSLDVNILQNLQKIPDLASAIPKIRESVDVLGRLLRRDLSFSTLREILDLATSTHLQAAFQWRPYFQVLTEYLPALLSTMSSMGHYPENLIGRGSFRTKLHNVLGREEVTILTRSKIVMDGSPSGLLSTILGADAIGILPKPSNLWDLVPFTFVVNWFTGVGNAIRRAEYALLLTSLPAYYIHSYTITSPLTAFELDSLEMSSSGAEPASLRLYYRDISRFTPVVRDSKFGFGIPSGFTNGGTLGSLLYQLLS